MGPFLSQPLLPPTSGLRLQLRNKWLLSPPKQQQQPPEQPTANRCSMAASKQTSNDGRNDQAKELAS